MNISVLILWVFAPPHSDSWEQIYRLYFHRAVMWSSQWDTHTNRHCVLNYMFTRLHKGSMFTGNLLQEKKKVQLVSERRKQLPFSQADGVQSHFHPLPLGLFYFAFLCKKWKKERKKPPKKRRVWTGRSSERSLCHWDEKMMGKKGAWWKRTDETSWKKI